MCISVRRLARYALLCLTLLGALLLCRWAGLQSGAVSAALSDLSGEQLAEQRALLASYGWEVGEAPTCDSVTLPEAFPSSYDGYLAVQAECGFHLEDYAGQTLLRCTWQVNNYPGWPDGVYADLLTLDGAVVGGDVRSSQLDGFLQSLRYPVTSAASPPDAQSDGYRSS